MPRTVYSHQGETVDAVCYRHYGRTVESTETVYADNPGLCDLGPVLPLGTAIVLPDVAPKRERHMIHLWD